MYLGTIIDPPGRYLRYLGDRRYLPSRRSEGPALGTSRKCGAARELRGTRKRQQVNRNIVSQAALAARQLAASLRQNRETDSAVASSGVSGNARFAIEVEVAVARVGRRAARIAHVTRFSEQAKPQHGTWPYTRRRKIAVTRILGRRT